MLKAATLNALNKLFCLALLSGFLFCSGHLSAQNKSVNLILFQNQELTQQKDFKDTLDAYRYLENKLLNSQKKGYFTAGYDSIVNKNGNLSAYYNQGEKYTWGKVSFVGNKHIIDTLKWTNEVVKKAPSPRYFSRVMQELQQKMLNLGYVKAEVLSEKVNLSDGKIDWMIRLNAGKQYTIDSLIVSPADKFPLKVLYYRYNVFPKDNFSLSKFQLLSEGNLNPTWLAPKSPAQLKINDTTCSIFLNYKLKKKNKLNAMLGLVPGNSTENLHLTGDVQLHLLSALRLAETIAFEWRSYQPKSQSLHILYSQPVIIKAWGIDGEFNLQKQDSSYINIHTRAGVNRLQYASEFNVFFDWFQSNIITPKLMQDTLQFARHQKLGLSYRRSNFDYPNNPRKGYQFRIESSAGVRKVAKLETLSPMFDANTEAEFYLPVQKRLSIKFNAKAAYRYGKKQFTQNEMYRLGGMKNLRGYQELSIFTNAYGLFSLETLFYPDKESVIFIFGDIASVNHKNLIAKYPLNIFWSMGAGIKLNTNIGLFHLSFAVPRSTSSLFDFRVSKIHFGYINYF